MRREARTTAIGLARDEIFRRHRLAVVGCLLLTVCAGPSAEARWVKAGVDDATAAREINDCRAEASAALKMQQGINEDRSATLGRNWALSYTTGINEQTMRQQAAAIADQTFNNCMRAKGFTKSG
jgi:hypothetical protein